MDSLLQWLEVPLDSWLACAAVLLLGAFVQRATGFGLAVVGAPLLLMIGAGDFGAVWFHCLFDNGAPLLA